MNPIAIIDKYYPTDNELKNILLVQIGVLILNCHKHLT